jgi:hypothetical protein
MVGSRVKGSLLFSDLEVNGFLSLAKAKISQDIDFRRIKVKNSTYEGLTILGDLYLNQAIIQGNMDITEGVIDGNLDLSVVCIQKTVDLTSTTIGNLLFLRDALIRGNLVIEHTKYKKIIRHFV